ncbi:MAG TPA: DUF3093 domain-containing protein [Homoserinimonas sp.]|nr:DUF3093 domain-containing protein [Homoserinimonas sp.]
MTYYRERLWPAAWIYISLGLVIPASILVFMPINQLVGVITGLCLYLGCAGLLTATAPTLLVTEHQLVAGRAALPLSLVGEATGFEGSEATMERGQRLDARAWLLIRGWVGPVVKIVVADEADPTPYWLVSTRKPDEFISAIVTARDSAPSQ